MSYKFNKYKKSPEDSIARRDMLSKKSRYEISLFFLCLIGIFYVD